MRWPTFLAGFAPENNLCLVKMAVPYIIFRHLNPVETKWTGEKLFKKKKKKEWEAEDSMKSKGEWRNQQVVTGFRGSICDVQGDLKSRRKLKQWRETWRERQKGGVEKDLKRQERLRFCRKRLGVQISMLGRVNMWYIRLEIYWGKQPEDRMRRSKR